jgi:NitT/TauT family transport system permease protein
MTLDQARVEVEESHAASARVSRWRRLRPGDWAVRVGAIALVLGVWELYGPALNKLILRPPSDIFRAFFELVANGELADAMSQSFRELFGGLAVALVVGLVLGIASGRWRFVFNAIDPLVSALYSVPAVALIPLLPVAFRSIGDPPRIAAVALFAVFPILINTQQGVRNVDRQLLEVARSFNTSERRLWTDVIVPSATPYVLAGVRLAIGRGLIGMIVAEFFIGLVGLGYLIISYENVFRIDRMFVPVIVVATMGVLLMGLVQWVEGRIAPWLKKDQ